MIFDNPDRAPVKVSATLLLVMCLAGCAGKSDSWVETVPAPAPTVTYPGNYGFFQSWYGMERGGAAYRSPGFEHTLVSPYFVRWPGGSQYIAPPPAPEKTRQAVTAVKPARHKSTQHPVTAAKQSKPVKDKANVHKASVTKKPVKPVKPAKPAQNQCSCGT